MAEVENSQFNRRRLSILFIAVGFIFLAGFSYDSMASPVTYSINSVPTKTFGPGTSFHNLIHGTPYCTGVTTGALTSRKASHPTFVFFGVYSIQDVNVTGQIILVQFEIGQTAPTTVFAAGDCATAPAGIVYSQYFPITGVYFTSSVAATDIVTPGGIYYAWVSIVAVNTDVRIIVSQSAARPSIVLQEQV